MNTNEFHISFPGNPHLLFSTATSHRGTRRALGSYAAGTHFEFKLKSVTGSTVNWWSTRTANSPDGKEHVRITEPYASCLPSTARAYVLSWEDLWGGGDSDFNDMIAVVRVNSDTDGDGLWDDWERCGIDDDGDPVTPRKTMPDANWQRKDI